MTEMHHIVGFLAKATESEEGTSTTIYFGCTGGCPCHDCLDRVHWSMNLEDKRLATPHVQFTRPIGDFFKPYTHQPGKYPHFDEYLEDNKNVVGKPLWINKNHIED